MDKSELFLFLGKCLALDGNISVREQVRRKIPDYPVGALVEMAVSHGLLSALYALFRRNQLIDLFPEGLSGFMEQTYALNKEKNRRILEQVKEIGEAFDTHGIHLVLMKGAGYLIEGLYADPAERIMTDIDLLVSERDWPEASAVLEEMGYYHPEAVLKGDYGDHRHLPPFVHPEKEVPVELHRNPLHGDFDWALPTEDVMNDSIVMGKVPIRIMSPAHQQVMQFMHERHHTRGKLSSIGTLRGMYDFYLLAKRKTPEKKDILKKNWQNRYLQYAETVSQVITYQFPGKSPGKRQKTNYLRKELFLLRHPNLNKYYFQMIYRSVYLTGLTAKSLFPSTSRRLLARKWRNQVFRRQPF